MTGVAHLRGSRDKGYRTASGALDCPHCHQPVLVAASAQSDDRGPYLAVYAVAPDPPGTYTERELAGITRGAPANATGVAMPQDGRGRAPDLPEDPIPAWAPG